MPEIDERLASLETKVETLDRKLTSKLGEISTNITYIAERLSRPKMLPGIALIISLIAILLAITL